MSSGVQQKINKYTCIFIFVYVYRRLGGVIDPNREIGFGPVAVRCEAVCAREGERFC